MKILFASRYVDPIDSRANRIIVQQARCLQDEYGLDLEILTWPHRDHWTGPVATQIPTNDPLRMVRDGLSYVVIAGHMNWNELAGGNCISDNDWDDAINYGMQLLKKLKPDVFHLHHRFGFWWLLVAAQRLGIPTVYTNYDWGMACLRTVLVKGDGNLCDGIITPEKCAACIKIGRTRVLAKFNEMLVETRFGEKILNVLNDSSISGDKFRSIGAVRQSALQRTTTHLNRVTSTVRGLSHLITPSEFGKKFFKQFGISEVNVKVMPWFHDIAEVSQPQSLINKPFTLTFIGRVSPEKGVHLIFEALELLTDIPTVLLRVASANDSAYCKSLINRYGSNVGKHHVSWQEWTQNWSPIVELLLTTDVTVIPSTCMDNTPLSLIESMAYQVPVIATSIPSITGLNEIDGVGYFAEFNSVESLSMAIRNAVLNQEFIRSHKSKFPKIPTAREYSGELLNIYSSIT